MLRNITEKLTGIIDNTGNKIVFYNDKYDFNLLANDSNIQKELNKINTPDGFIYGTTYSGNKIAIHTNITALSIVPDNHVYTDLYLESEFNSENIDIKHFHSIVFVGGILNQLRIKHSFDYTDKNDEIFEYQFSVKDEKCTITTGFYSNGTATETAGAQWFDTFLRLTFDEEQPITSLRQHYINVNQMVSFLTHRTENHFSAVFIVPSFDNSDWFFNRVFVHYKESDDAKYFQKPCIKFDDIGESISILMEMIYNSKDNKPSYSLGFIPDREENRFNFTDNTVRSICSALECEVTCRKKQIGKSQNAELLALCKIVKSIIKEHETEHKDEPLLSEGTYNMIYGSIKNWSMSAVEKFIALYDMFENEMAIFHRRMPPFNVNDIHELVKYRNTITHGRYQKMPKQIHSVILSMKALIYCSLLDRIKVSREKIKYLCGFHFFF